jgi:hypothetical protein
MKITLTTYLILCLGFLSLGQVKEVTFYGTVRDRNEKKVAIPEVKIKTPSQTSIPFYTSPTGEFEIKIQEKLVNDTIIFSRPGFETFYYIVTPKMMKRYRKSRIQLNVTLKTWEFEPFNFTVQKVDTAYGSTFHYVEDYIPLKNEKILLLVYEKNLRSGAKIILTDKSQKDISSYTIPGDAQYLYSDYAHNNYVVCTYQVFRIEHVHDIVKLYKVHKDDFYGFHQRIIDTIQDNYYYTNYNELYPAVQIFSTNRVDSNRTMLREVKDDFMMELYRAQYKYVSGRDKLWAYRKEQATGIDKEIWIGAASFTQDILYQPVYSPVFIVDDSCFLFDQYKSYLYKYDEFNNLADSVYVNYYVPREGEKWEQPLIKDPVTNMIYGLYNKGGFNYIKMINCQTGLLEGGLKLNNRFVENIQIYNGYIYYTYRPFESLQKKFLYKERLPIDISLNN